MPRKMDAANVLVNHFSFTVAMTAIGVQASLLCGSDENTQKTKTSIKKQYAGVVMRWLAPKHQRCPGTVTTSHSNSYQHDVPKHLYTLDPKSATPKAEDDRQTADTARSTVQPTGAR